jgi:hypothetical protein
MYYQTLLRCSIYESASNKNHDFASFSFAFGNTKYYQFIGILHRYIFFSVIGTGRDISVVEFLPRDQEIVSSSPFQVIASSNLTRKIGSDSFFAKRS